MRFLYVLSTCPFLVFNDLILLSVRDEADGDAHRGVGAACGGVSSDKITHGVVGDGASFNLKSDLGQFEVFVAISFLKLVFF